MHIEGTARCAADTDPAQAIQHVGASIQIVGASIVLQIRQGQRLSDRDDMVWHTSRAFPDVFICSCTEQIMTDPVVTVDGQVFESSLIEEWFRIQWLSSSRNHHVQPDNTEASPQEAYMPVINCAS